MRTSIKQTRKRLCRVLSLETWDSLDWPVWSGLCMKSIPALSVTHTDLIADFLQDLGPISTPPRWASWNHPSGAFRRYVCACCRVLRVLSRIHSAVDSHRKPLSGARINDNPV